MTVLHAIPMDVCDLPWQPIPASYQLVVRGMLGATYGFGHTLYMTNVAIHDEHAWDKLDSCCPFVDLTPLRGRPDLVAFAPKLASRGPALEDYLDFWRGHGAKIGVR